MDDPVRPSGQLFSRVYVKRGPPSLDSARFRSRLLSYFDSRASDEQKHRLLNAVRTELGYRFRNAVSPNAIERQKLFLETNANDFMDLITLVHHSIGSIQHPLSQIGWVSFCRRSMVEENVRYMMDDAGGVHYMVDEEFEALSHSAVSALSGQRYLATAQHIRDCLRALDRFPDGARDAVRYAFDGAETIFKLMYPRASRLGSSELKAEVSPTLQRAYSGAARDAANRMVASFGNWVDGSHQYRHAQGTEAPEPPPADLAIVMISSGLGFIRWMAELDQRMLQASGVDEPS